MSHLIEGRGRGAGLVAVVSAVLLLAAACGDSDSSSASTGGNVTTTEASNALPAFGTSERCELNRQAGKLIFMTGFDFAAAAGIIDIVVAEQEGFFDDMCLDVELQSGVAPGNSAALAAGTVQLSASASFGELVKQNVNGGADIMAFSQLGHTSIAELLVPTSSGVGDLTDLEGLTMGIKGDIPFAVLAMLEIAGLERGTFTELLLDGFDPVSHFELGIDALPVFKSNEPSTLDAAGLAYTAYDPLDFDVPASFAVYMTTRSFYEQNPTVVQDFVRAGLRGYYFAAENPEAAIDDAFELIDAAGNQFFLAQAHELDRWLVEQKLVADVTPDGFDIGQLNVSRLGEEIELATQLGVFESLPDWESMYDATIVPGLYEGGELIWESMK